MNVETGFQKRLEGRNSYKDSEGKLYTLTGNSGKACKFQTCKPVFSYHHSLFHFQQKQIWVWIYTFPCTNVKILSLTDGNTKTLCFHSLVGRNAQKEANIRNGMQ